MKIPVISHTEIRLGVADAFVFYRDEDEEAASYKIICTKTRTICSGEVFWVRLENNLAYLEE